MLYMSLACFPVSSGAVGGPSDGAGSLGRCVWGQREADTFHLSHPQNAPDPAKQGHRDRVH